MKYSLLFFAMLLSSSAISQQGNSFLFSADSVVTPFISSGITNTIVPAANQDDFAYLFSPTGMNINFGCKSYSKFVVSTNGWLAFVPSNTSGIPSDLSAGGYLNTNSLSTYSTTYPILAPYWDDLSTTLISIEYSVGVLWVAWTGRVDKNNSSAARSFWIKVDGNSGVVEFNYENSPYAINGQPSASIGISGRCNNGFYSYDAINSPPYADSISETSNINLLPQGVRYTFTPYEEHSLCQNALDLGTMTHFCTQALFSQYNCNSPGSTICLTADSSSLWFKISKPAGMQIVNFRTFPDSLCMAVDGASLEVYDFCGGSILGCATSSTSNPDFAELTLMRPITPEDFLIRVSPRDNAGGSFYLCTYSPFSTNIDEHLPDAGNILAVFPNPAVDEIKVYGSEQTINIYDMLGSVVSTPASEENGNEKTINISSLPKGAYFLRSGNSVGRFIKR